MRRPNSAGVLVTRLCIEVERQNSRRLTVGLNKDVHMHDVRDVHLPSAEITMNHLSGRDKEAQNGDGIPFLAAAPFKVLYQVIVLVRIWHFFMTLDFSISVNIME